MKEKYEVIIATAGHIDHGKTRLLHALTGIDTDRLPQEKKRGISIDLGFAYYDLGDGLSLGFGLNSIVFLPLGISSIIDKSRSPNIVACKDLGIGVADITKK